MALSTALKRAIRERASGCCEYCRMAEQWESFYPYHCEYIVAKQHDGSDDPENLAFACHHCNLLKGPNLTSIDPETGEVTLLFHPRQQGWSEHFRFASEKIIGLTAVGRATVFLLQMNATHRIELRAENKLKSDD